MPEHHSTTPAAATHHAVPHQDAQPAPDAHEDVDAAAATADAHEEAVPPSLPLPHPHAQPEPDMDADNHAADDPAQQPAHDVDPTPVDFDKLSAAIKSLRADYKRLGDAFLDLAVSLRALNLILDRYDDGGRGAGEPHDATGADRGQYWG